MAIKNTSSSGVLQRAELETDPSSLEQSRELEWMVNAEWLEFSFCFDLIATVL